MATLALALVLSVALPLVTYTATLAALGAAHVFAELRYVDRRFGARISARLLAALGALVLAIVACRVAGNLGISTRVAELGLGIALVTAVVPSASGRARTIAAAVGGALAVGIVASPVHALLVIAVLHNLTPLAFVAESRASRRAFVHAAIVFVALPAVVLLGWPWEILLAMGVTAPEATLGFPGPLELHMRAYLPTEWTGAPGALHAFSACAFLQCAHYLYVIDVLPRSLPDAPRGRLPWPRHFAGWLLALGVATTCAFALGDFFGVRAWYGVLAALHAWIELPILLLALSARD